MITSYYVCAHAYRKNVINKHIPNFKWENRNWNMNNKNSSWKIGNFDLDNKKISRI